MNDQRMVDVRLLEEVVAFCEFWKQERGLSLRDKVKAIIDGPGVEPVAWESTTPAFTRYVTQSRYDSFSPETKAWYKPYRCSACAAPSAPKQAVPDGWIPTNEELTNIYNTANGIWQGKRPPITTERIFTAMRAMLAAPQPPKETGE